MPQSKVERSLNEQDIRRQIAIEAFMLFRWLDGDRHRQAVHELAYYLMTPTDEGTPLKVAGLLDTDDGRVLNFILKSGGPGTSIYLAFDLASDLCDLFGEEGAKSWLGTPCADLNDEPPLALCSDHRIATVFPVVKRLRDSVKS